MYSLEYLCIDNYACAHTLINKVINMATYMKHLFDMETDKGSSIEMFGRSDMPLTVQVSVFIKDNELSMKQVQFKDLDTFQNFILLNSDKGLNNEQNLDKLAHILYTNEVTYYE